MGEVFDLVCHAAGGEGCAALVVVLVRAPARLWGVELRTWAWADLLYRRALTRLMMSVICYALLQSSPGGRFPEIGQQVTTRRDRLALAALR